MQYLSDKDYADYGSDLVMFAKKAAAEAVGPQIQHLDHQNQQLRVRLAREARARMDMRVEAAVPSFRDIDRDPAWHRYLLEVDALSGRIRQVLLDDAISAGDADRVVQFFRAFQRSQGAADYASPSAYRRTGSSGKPTYTRASIQALYSAHRKGAYVGHEDAWERQEQDIIAAGREGRVLDPDRISK